MASKALTYSALTSTGWVDEPTDFAPALDGEIRCDVAVIGGGYTGMAAALSWPSAAPTSPSSSPGSAAAARVRATRAK